MTTAEAMLRQQHGRRCGRGAAAAMQAALSAGEARGNGSARCSRLCRYLCRRCSRHCGRHPAVRAANSWAQSSSLAGLTSCSVQQLDALAMRASASTSAERLSTATAGGTASGGAPNASPPQPRSECSTRHEATACRLAGSRRGPRPKAPCMREPTMRAAPRRRTRGTEPRERRKRK